MKIYNLRLFWRLGLMLLLNLSLLSKIVKADYYYDYPLYDDQNLAEYYGEHLTESTELAKPTTPQIGTMPKPEKGQVDPKSLKESASTEKKFVSSTTTKSTTKFPAVTESYSAVADKSHEVTEPYYTVSDQSYTTTEQSRSTSEGYLERSEETRQGAAVGPDIQLRMLAYQNANALRQITNVMSTVVSKLSGQRCSDTGESGHTLQELSKSIKEGFTVLVEAVQDLNTTLRHYRQDIARKVFGIEDNTVFENNGQCPSPFIPVGEDCLYFETEYLRDFNSARQACIDMGAKLAELTSFQPFIDAVRAMGLRRDTSIYIGGSDEDSEGDWKWLSGRRMDNIPWGEDEPNNIGEREHCITYSVDMNSFNDLNCDNRCEYACMIK